MTASPPSSSAAPPSDIGGPDGRPPLASERGEIAALTGLRLLAAAWVVGFHYFHSPGDTYARVLEPLRPLLEAGELGVDLFFVLSGVVITHTYVHKLGPRLRLRAAGSFLWARFSRIWPVYALVTVAFGAWLLLRARYDSDGFIVYQEQQPDLGVLAWLRQLLMVQLWAPPEHAGPSFVGPGWSISAEWLAYVCFPALVLLAWRLRRLPPAVLGVAALVPLAPQVFTAVLTPAPPVADYSWAVRLAGGFTSGVLVWLAVHRLPRTARVSRIAAWVAVAALVEIGIVLWGSAAVGAQPLADLALLAFPVLIGALALSGTGPAALLARPWAVHGGRISFSLYMVHIPIFELWYTVMATFAVLAPDRALAALLFPHVLLLPFLVAHLSWRWVEEPAREWLRAHDPFRRGTEVIEVVRHGTPSRPQPQLQEA